MSNITTDIRNNDLIAKIDVPNKNRILSFSLYMNKSLFPKYIK